MPIVTVDRARCEASRGGGETSRATAAGHCSGEGKQGVRRRFPSPVLRPPGWGPIMPARDFADGHGGTNAL